MATILRSAPLRSACLIGCCAALMASMMAPAAVLADETGPLNRPPADAPATTAETSSSSNKGIASSDKDDAKKEDAPKATPRKRPSPKQVNRGRKSMTPDPNAKWACDQTAVSAEPVWRNAGSSVDFAFKIRNEGTAPLKIRAKGG